MLNSKRPKFNISHIRPMDGGMMEHSSSNGEDGANSALCNSIGVMGSNTRMSNGLMEFGQMSFKVFAEKLGSIVTEVTLWNDSMVSTVLLKGFLCSESFMRVELSLELNEHKSRSMINKDTSSFEFPINALLAIGV